MYVTFSVDFCSLTLNDAEVPVPYGVKNEGLSFAIDALVSRYDSA